MARTKQDYEFKVIKASDLQTINNQINSLNKEHKCMQKTLTELISQNIYLKNSLIYIKNKKEPLYAEDVLIKEIFKKIDYLNSIIIGEENNILNLTNFNKKIRFIEKEVNQHSTTLSGINLNEKQIKFLSKKLEKLMEAIKSINKRVKAIENNEIKELCK